jgi:aryl-alcohol dehydrogenase-like predicted oxidoreductase
VGEEMSVRGVQWPKEIKASKDYINNHGKSLPFGCVETRIYANNISLGLSRTAIFNAVDASLKRLDLDYIDLLQIHRFDPETPLEETMEALHDLVKSGKVRYIGASSMWATQFAQLQFVAEKNGWTKFISMQNHYSLLYREEEREMNRFCNDTGVGLIPVSFSFVTCQFFQGYSANVTQWAPLFRGHLARPLDKLGKTTRSAPEVGKGLTEADEGIVKRVQELADKKGWKMSQVALAWINKRIASPIIGFSSVERIEEALDVKGKTLTDEEEKYLEELYQPKDIIGHS